MTKKQPAIEVIEEDECAGCFGCYNSCPYNAIDMKCDEYGFYLPFINKNCTHCGICLNHCPVIQDTEKEDKFKKPFFYGGRSKDHKIRMMSSSGGIFPELAKHILDQSGVVFGAGWGDNFNLEHIKISDFDEIKKISGSKYVQSKIGEAYKKVLKELDKGTKVLFAGTPCQIKALNTFSDHENLLTVDLVCHGVPSNFLFEKYLAYLEKEKKATIKQVSFRDKKKGWQDYQMKIKFQNGSVYENSTNLDPYFRAYLPNLCLRDSCYKCEFQDIPRSGDITLGDFWGNPPEEITTDEGVSVILVNTKKGKNALQHLQKLNAIEIKKTDFKTATKNNPRIKGDDFVKPDSRTKFLEDITTKDFEIIQDKYIDIPNPIKYKFFQYIEKLLKYIS